MAGREIVDHGLPRTEEITILGQGATWTDQQWLAQLVFYAAHELAGLRAVVVLDILLVLLALSSPRAPARSIGASSRSTFLIGLLASSPARGAGRSARSRSRSPSSRASSGCSSTATGTGSAAARCSSSRCSSCGRTSTDRSSSAQAHGAARRLACSCATGARRRSCPRPSSCSRRSASWPRQYGWDIVAYYDLMLVDAPFAEILREWQWSKPSGTTALFWFLALVAVALLALRRCRSRLSTFELLVLGVTFVGAVQAVRGVIWFALVCAAILRPRSTGSYAAPTRRPGGSTS